MAGIFSASLIDDNLSIPNKNKKKLAIIMLGPFSWTIHLIYFIIISITPLYNKIIEWFEEE